jgi:hypothetical protein
VVTPLACVRLPSLGRFQSFSVCVKTSVPSTSLRAGSPETVSQLRAVPPGLDFVPLFCYPALTCRAFLCRRFAAGANSALHFFGALTRTLYCKRSESAGCLRSLSSFGSSPLRSSYSRPSTLDHAEAPSGRFATVYVMSSDNYHGDLSTTGVRIVHVKGPL